MRGWEKLSRKRAIQILMKEYSDKEIKVMPYANVAAQGKSPSAMELTSK
jgi:hypothetical protein